MSHPDADCSSCVWNVPNKQKYREILLLREWKQKSRPERRVFWPPFSFSDAELAQLASALLVNYGNCSLGASFLGRDETAQMQQTWLWLHVKRGKLVKNEGSKDKKSLSWSSEQRSWSEIWQREPGREIICFGVKTGEDIHWCHFFHIVSAVWWNLSRKPQK